MNCFRNAKEKYVSIGKDPHGQLEIQCDRTYPLINTVFSRIEAAASINIFVKKNCYGISSVINMLDVITLKLIFYIRLASLYYFFYLNCALYLRAASIRENNVYDDSIMGLMSNHLFQLFLWVLKGS